MTRKHDADTQKSNTRNDQKITQYIIHLPHSDNYLSYDALLGLYMYNT
jgi:hypothetical protein